MVFSCIGTRSLPRLRSELENQGFRVYEIEGSSISNEASFLKIFSTAVPFAVYSPGDSGPVLNWDAFCDCLWGGLKGQPDERVALLWLSADKLLAGHLTLLVEAVECISGEAQNLLGPDHPIVLQVYLVGDGANFPDWPDDWRPLTTS